MKLRRASLEARFSSEELDEDLLELAYTEYQLAQFAAGARRIDAFDEALERGLVWLDRYRENTGTPSGVLPLERRLLQEYAEAHLVRKRPLEDMSLDLRKRLEVSYASMCTNPSPEWAADRRLFGVYLALLDLE